jgi:hypothetical protein
MSNGVLIDDQMHFTGLLVPEVRPLSFPAFAEAEPILSVAEITDILSDPERTKRREMWANGQWIKNQGSRGSCNGYAAAKALERARVIRGLEHVPLSGEFVYAGINGGRDQGSQLDDGMKWITENGVAPEALVPHQEFLWNRVSAAAKAEAPRFKAFECYRVDTEIELATGLAMGWVGVVAVHAGGGYMRLDSRGVRGTANGPGNHATGVDDVKIVDGQFLFDEWGSWGLNNGQNGYAYLTWRQHLAQTIKWHSFYLLRSTTDDPKQENPKAA